ncbi:Shedu anti-phage system protein SduA domain-containing protein [Flavobacterium oreochromis]|uniref:Shedu anti-phage system protein SduA domain-containing protein n=1 Tax=Flavobacterium oreochromis TaxID=2906078 RepID=UPI00385BA9B5
MSRIDNFTNPFEKMFNLIDNDITELQINENNEKKNCYLIDKKGEYYGGFELINKRNSKTICKILFIKSTITGKYLPRLEFRKIDDTGESKQPKGKDIIIKFSDSEEALNFWKMITFLQGFKELVDLGDLKKHYKAVSFDNYIIEFKSKSQEEKVKELIELAENSKLSNDEIKVIIKNQRKRIIYGFYCFLKNIEIKSKNPFDYYREDREIKEAGEEVVWHHFFKENDWIIGLNVDIKFIRDFLSEQKIGTENSQGKGSPMLDLLGISYFTTLIELKTSNTKIFKTNKSSNSRTNTWDFTSEFIEAYSQTLSQRTEIHKNKEIIEEDGKKLDTEIHRILDPKSVLIFGNRNIEFSHNRSVENSIKSDCFERFRRDIRNVEIITFDELFERAYHIVYSEKLPLNWYDFNEQDFIKNILKL